MSVLMVGVTMPEVGVAISYLLCSSPQAEVLLRELTALPPRITARDTRIKGQGKSSVHGLVVTQLMKELRIEEPINRNSSRRNKKVGKRIGETDP